MSTWNIYLIHNFFLCISSVSLFFISETRSWLAPYWMQTVLGWNTVTSGPIPQLFTLIEGYGEIYWNVFLLHHLVFDHKFLLSQEWIVLLDLPFVYPGFELLSPDLIHWEMQDRASVNNSPSSATDPCHLQHDIPWGNAWLGKVERGDGWRQNTHCW